MSRQAVVTGAGSGVGRAVAVRLAQAGWNVAALGRRLEALQETALLAPGGAIVAEPCDVTAARLVEAVRDRVQARWGAVDAVVAAAGINVPARALADLSTEDFARVINVNLLGAFHVVRAFVPLMRDRDRATVVTIVSDAGLLASEKAGAAYVASKFGLTGLTDTINAELRGQGIRACAIFPGDVDSPLLDQRAVPPSAASRAAMLQPGDVADCVMLAINLPHRAILERLVVRPR
jgi:NAD(P)-dependent dehydrogenase (short-subunit alcohol dehydrogenase family)